MKKTIITILVTIYAIIAIFTTICLLSYNDSHISTFGNTSLIIIDSKDLEKNQPPFFMGDIVFVTKSKNLNKNDHVFCYEVYNGEVSISVAKINNISVDERSKTNKYELSDGRTLDYNFIIGPVNGASKMAKVGYVLKVLESKFGYLFLVVLPTLLLFLYELYTIVMQIKDGSSDDEDEDDEEEEEEEVKPKKTSAKKTSSKTTKKRVTKKTTTKKSK